MDSQLCLTSCPCPELLSTSCSTHLAKVTESLTVEITFGDRVTGSPLSRIAANDGCRDQQCPVLFLIVHGRTSQENKKRTSISDFPWLLCLRMLTCELLLRFPLLATDMARRRKSSSDVFPKLLIAGIGLWLFVHLLQNSSFQAFLLLVAVGVGAFLFLRHQQRIKRQDALLRAKLNPLF